MGNLTIGAIYRYASFNSPELAEIDGLPNLLFHTNTPGQKKTLLEAGINPVGIVKSISGSRTPAILITSSTHKQGSKETPWQDDFDVDNGYIKYYGDNKTLRDPGDAPGNRIILRQFTLHNSRLEEDRMKAVPFVFFKSISVEGRVKGNRIFQGIGLVRTAQLVTQYQKDIGYFTNYVFEFDVLELRQEFELFSWDWISARRNPLLSNAETVNFAPKAWQDWLKNGELARDRVIRKILKSTHVSKIEQLPTKNSREEKCLEQILNYYKGKRHHFELLAAKVVANVVRQSGGSYSEGWITKGSGDGGIDFVGRIDLGSGFAKVEIIVLGQAKCESFARPTNGVHLARTVSRLKRGWIGAYVTTSFFSEPSQAEISGDQYPLLTVSGLDLARETLKLVELSGAASVQDFLEKLDSNFSGYIEKRDPEDILGR